MCQIWKKNIQNIANTHISDYMKERKNNPMFIGGVTEYDVMKVVNNLKKKVSKDCNDIDMTIIKTIIYEIVTPFTYICNQSFLSGTFPNKMKLAKVIPLYKTGKQNAFTNYRPVSLLPQFSKILEKLFRNNWMCLLKSKIYYARVNMASEVIDQPQWRCWN